MPEEPKPPIMDYARPPASRMGWTMLGVVGGIFGYLGMLALICFILTSSYVDQRSLPEWLWTLIVIAVPLGSMLLAAYVFKSRPMVISVLITFGVVLLSCGTCIALLGSGGFR